MSMHNYVSLFKLFLEESNNSGLQINFLWTSIGFTPINGAIFEIVKSI